eukprot:scaffold27067_cov223-Skeletonema_menzelii.AAC.3
MNYLRNCSNITSMSNVFNIHVSVESYAHLAACTSLCVSKHHFRPRNLTFPYQIPWSIAKLENQIPRSRPNSEVDVGISNSDFPR